jgi:2-polyprenyl-3-methyl-5-hydroxy-6-metoxy-1,4-benzoquinol methylase
MQQFGFLILWAMGKLAFALNLVRKHATKQDCACPYCGNEQTIILQHKRMIMQLRRCEQCLLMFRYPKDDQNENKSFYQRKYQQSTVTELPQKEEIPHHVATRFVEVGRDLTEHLETIRAIAPHGRLLDYGCSWGYCVYQFREVGYEASGFEISQPRVEYGSSALGVELTSDIEQLPDSSFDIIYSAHVLEHIPDPAISFRQFQRLLKPGGMLFVYVPNCGGEAAHRLGIHWGPMINEKHVLALAADFFQQSLPSYGFSLQFSSSPYNESPRKYEDHPPLSGEELLVIGQRV